jgi:NAD(P) transhydrogenase subunit alpha
MTRHANASPVGRNKRQRIAPSCGQVRSGASAEYGFAYCALLAAMLALAPTAALAAGGDDVSPLVYQFMVFVIAIFVGYYVVWSVTPALHTPLMSVTNAISSVIVVGALLAVGVSLVAAGSLLAKLFGFLALVMASVNIFGGFLVTQRMLAMYKKREPKK